MSNTQHAGFSDTDDEWVDSEGLTSARRVVPVPWSVLDGVPFPKGTHKYNEGLSETLGVDNIDMDNGVLTILRCQPVKHRYPTIRFPDTYSQYSRVLVSMAMFHHGLEHVPVRFPDTKDKCEQHRSESGLWLNPSANLAVKLKKKATDKVTKKHVAFRVGSEFKFLTGELDPFFVIIATPFVNGAFQTEHAIRSKPFIVKSKSSTSNRPPKRRKKARELDKLNTDIASARLEKQTLERDETRASYLITQHARFLQRLNQRAMELHEGPAKIALIHATRDIVKTAETVSL